MPARPPYPRVALFLEILATAIFLVVILQSSASERHGGTALLAIPLTLLTAHVALIPFSGSSLNTARSFGPALIGNEWPDFWVYIIGPPLGAVLGFVVYAVVSKLNARGHDAGGEALRIARSRIASIFSA